MNACPDQYGRALSYAPQLAGAKSAGGAVEHAGGRRVPGGRDPPILFVAFRADLQRAQIIPKYFVRLAELCAKMGAARVSALRRSSAH